MTKRPPTNVAASVRDRLLDRSRRAGEDFQFLLQRYAAERFLYRLGQSRYRDRFVLKGAMLFALWGGSVYRPTRDLDFTGYGSSDSGEVIAAFKEVCAIAVAGDGLAFDATSITAEPIRDETQYQGLRVRFKAASAPRGSGCRSTSASEILSSRRRTTCNNPTLLEAPAPRIRAYPHAAVVAEKLHIIVVLGERTSRMKDFYDLHALATQFRFEGPALIRAIAATFERRKTKIDAALPAALAPRFFSDAARAGQWHAYLDRNRLPGGPRDFTQVGERIRGFLEPAWTALGAGKTFKAIWPPGGPWEAGS
jgi:predicted nucleotidyltransferase component of viral defense system